MIIEPAPDKYPNSPFNDNKSSIEFPEKEFSEHLNTLVWEFFHWWHNENIKTEQKDKTKYLIPYCFECGAEYEDQSCCPDKLISYIHPKFLKKLKEAKFGVQYFRS